MSEPIRASNSGIRGQTETTISSGFWQKYQRLVNEKVLPYQWRALNDEIEGAPKSHSIENFRVAAGMSNSEYQGMVFQDSDLAKWIEAVGHALRYAKKQSASPSESVKQLETRVRETVQLVTAAQQPDGYLNTYFTVKEPDLRWTNLRDAHELYCAGHMIEAAISVFEAIGDRQLLDAMVRFADHIDATFGGEQGKKPGYPGHQEIELALVKLYRLTGEKRFLTLAQYFIDERGRSPNYFEIEANEPQYRPIWDFDDGDHSYRQAHAPVREQSDAVGHSVRAMYQYIAMADLALETGDTSLREACERLWDSTTRRRMYVTGGIGSSRHGEAFTADFDLPNDTVYAESCAAIGLFILSNRMAALTGDARYPDVGERAMYNGVISGLSLDGTAYFYVNPLDVHPEYCDSSGTYEHVKYRRQPWYGCACCPPNIARIIASLGDYTCRTSGSTLYIDHFYAGAVRAEPAGGPIRLRLEGDYPWNGDLTFTVDEAHGTESTIAIRVPGWCSEPQLSVNGDATEIGTVTRGGYAHLRRVWSVGDRVRLVLPMPVRVIEADPRVRADFGRVSIQRGPLVYCLESVDNGRDLHTATLSSDPKFEVEHRPDLLGGVTVITAAGYTFDRTKATSSGELYRAVSESTHLSPCELTFVPYFAWSNREEGEMVVWVRQEGR